MKPLSIKFPFTVNDLLSYFDKLDTRDLQGVVDKLTNLISKRNNPTPEERDAFLLAIINKRLPTTFLQRFSDLKTKMEEGIIEKVEILEMDAYVEQIETFDTNKIEALHELATLRNVPFQKLAKDLAAFSRPHE